MAQTVIHMKSSAKGVVMRMVLLVALAGSLTWSLPVLGEADSQQDSPAILASEPASTLDLGLLFLSQQLFQAAVSDYDANGNREIFETRFIPHSVSAYQVREDGNARLNIVAQFTNSDPELSEDRVKQICSSMINWIRFRLGVKDDGSFIAYASDYESSTLYSFITPGRDLEGSAMENWARFLDERATVIGTINSIRSGARTGLCTMPLVGST